jgi:hypothetical protein
MLISRKSGYTIFCKNINQAATVGEICVFVAIVGKGISGQLSAAVSQRSKSPRPLYRENTGTPSIAWKRGRKTDDRGRREFVYSSAGTTIRITQMGAMTSWS